MILLNKKYLGVVEDINDPAKLGRARVRVAFCHGTKEQVPTKHLPWAYQKTSCFFGQGGQAGSISIPKKGAIVEVEFANGNQYHPTYSLNQILADDVKQELANEYEGTHIIAIDGDSTLKIWQTINKGLTIQFKDSKINFAKDSTITIEHKDSDSLIELHGGQMRQIANSLINQTAGSQIKSESNEVWSKGVVTKLGVTPLYSAVVGEQLFMLLTAMAKIIDDKMYPTPGLTESLVNDFKKFCLSQGVKVSWV